MTTRRRPAVLRALGHDDPPARIQVAGADYVRVDVFKHDSWAATALYRSAHGHKIVCKFNRVQSIFGVSMRWLGRRLAQREGRALTLLADQPGIPPVVGSIAADGQRLDHAVGHDFVEGEPLRDGARLDDRFFPALLTLLGEMHRRGMAYVDLHKRENVLVGDDGLPHLIDFQVSFGLWARRSTTNPVLCSVLGALQDSDLYHVGKHIARHRPDQMNLLADRARRPWWINAHRAVAVPLRQARRRLLTALGVRGKNGQATSEVFAEHAFRTQPRRAA